MDNVFNSTGSWRDEFKLKSDEDHQIGFIRSDSSIVSSGVNAPGREAKTFQMRFKISFNELDRGSNERIFDTSTGENETILTVNVSSDDLKSKGILPSLDVLKGLMSRYVDELKEEFVNKYYNTF